MTEEEVLAVQGWACVVDPGPASDERLRTLLTAAHARAAARHRKT
jgi:hypothetical protein